MSEPSKHQPSDRKRIWLRVAVVAFAGLIVCGAIFYLVLMSHLGELSKPTIIEYDEPMTLAEARRHSTLPFPESATNIRYACYSEFIAYIEVLRFEAPADDCKAFAEKAIAKHNTENPDRRTQTLRPMPASNRILAADQLAAPNKTLEPLKAPWFTPYTIRSGMIAGESGSHQPMIWIDLEKGTLYYLLTD